MKEFVIVLYTKKTGEKPVKCFLDSLETKMQAKTLRMITLLRQNGYDLREPYTKSLTDGILELRVIQGNNAVRILYIFVEGNTIVLTNGFIKKSNKTPRAALELAKKYRKDYLERLGCKHER